MELSPKMKRGVHICIGMAIAVILVIFTLIFLEYVRSRNDTSNTIVPPVPTAQDSYQNQLEALDTLRNSAPDKDYSGDSEAYKKTAETLDTLKSPTEDIRTSEEQVRALDALRNSQ